MSYTDTLESVSGLLGPDVRRFQQFHGSGISSLRGVGGGGSPEGSRGLGGVGQVGDINWKTSSINQDFVKDQDCVKFSSDLAQNCHAFSYI